MNRFKKSPFYLDDKGLEWVNNTYNNMDIEDKVGQLFCLVGYDVDKDYLMHVAKEKRAGALMLRPMTEKEAVDVVSILQSNSKIPMLMSSNIESGGNGVLINGTKVSSPMGIAATNDYKSAYILGDIAGKEAESAGINWAFAPIADIDFNYRNPITNTRTFGSNVNNVINYSKEYIKAIQKYDIAATAKHFPGDGVDDRDQHLVTTINDLIPEEWDKTFGKVYKNLIDSDVKTIMAGHISLPYYSKKLNDAIKDEDILPASLSKEIITDLLKKQLGFNGLVCTDATTMAGINIAMPRNELIPKAIAAGCDMLVFVRDMEEDFQYMYEGIEKGIITEERLEEAVKTVLALKASLKLHIKKENNTLFPKYEDITLTINDKNHKEQANIIANKSITLVKEEKGVIPISPEKYKKVLLYDISAEENLIGYGARKNAFNNFKELLIDSGYNIDVFKPKPGFEGMLQNYQEMVNKYDLIIYIANLATKSNQTTVRIEWSNPMGANIPIYIHSIPTIFISLENPYHLQDVPRVKTYINTYNSDEIVLNVLLEKLEGKSKFEGVSPIDPFCGKWDTSL